VVVSAPVDRVTTIPESHGHLADLLDDGRLSLVVVDPERDRALVYDGDLAWTRGRDCGRRPAHGPTTVEVRGED